MTDPARVARLLAKARAKGIADDDVLMIVESFGIDAAEEAISKGRKTMLKDELNYGTKELADLGRLRKQMKEAIAEMKRQQQTATAPTRQKASAPVQKPAPEPPKPSFWASAPASQQAAKQFWPGEPAKQKAYMIALPVETMDKARRLLNITDSVWTGLNFMFSEEQIGELLDYALKQSGYADGLVGVKSTEKHSFWGTRVKRG